MNQLNLYLDAVIQWRHNYKYLAEIVLTLRSNLYAIQLRPRIQDPYSKAANPVFTVDRRNNSQGIPLSPLYNKMHEVFPEIVLGKPDPCEILITKVLEALPQDISINENRDGFFENIQNVLATQCKAPEAFFKKKHDGSHQEQVIDRAYIEGLMGFDENTIPQDYIRALLSLCAPNLQTTFQGSPFFDLKSSANPEEKAEYLSILTQFYLGVLNIYCRAKNISNKNFGETLDGSPILSQNLVKIVEQALSQGNEVESALLAFFKAHHEEFSLSRDLTIDDKEAIQKKFETTYRTVTATKENPHMDDFMFLDRDAHDEKDIFITSNGLICTELANIVPLTDLNRSFFTDICNEARTRREMPIVQNEPMIMVETTIEALMKKSCSIQWEKLPQDVIEVCRVLPAFNLHRLLNDVVKGKQDEANALLHSSEDIHFLLRTPGQVTDYSGRIFNCTAYEYAYWAKDTHMRCMLENHMDDETKTLLLKKIDKIECSGITYQQHGLSYNNPHYDMSFILKSLSASEFNRLKAILGESNDKFNTATMENYQTISFTADEYEQLKRELAQQKIRSFMPTCITSFRFLCYLTYPVFFILSCLMTSPAEKLSKKLKFDFNSLITALDTYVTHYLPSDSTHERNMAWLEVGYAQRDVPVHIANEYCRPYPLKAHPGFNTETLPRTLIVANHIIHRPSHWFPLPSSSSGLGFDFTITRFQLGETSCEVDSRGFYADATRDLAFVRKLEEVRTTDLIHSHENLNQQNKNLFCSFDSS